MSSERGRSFAIPGDGLRLEEFVTMADNGWYEAEPPFDHAHLTSDGLDQVVSLDELSFGLVPSAP